MARIPAKLNALLQDLTSRLPLILGRELVGIYLYGSVTHSSFNTRRSDVDVIVVTRRDLSETQFRELRAWLVQTAKANPWTSRLQILFLVENELLVMNSTDCIYQFGVLKRCGSDGNPIIWLDFLRNGRVLFGPRPESFLPAITPEILFRALKRELGYLREEISEKPSSEWRDVPMYRAYVVLTVCRILYSFNKGDVVSKPKAAQWAIKNLPRRWKQIIRQAVDFNQTGRDPEITLKHIEQFIEFAQVQLA